MSAISDVFVVAIVVIVVSQCFQLLDIFSARGYTEIDTALM